jgi:hypothetical protein
MSKLESTVTNDKPINVKPQLIHTNLSNPVVTDNPIFMTPPFDEIQYIQKTLNVTDACAADIIYLRTRQRHTLELEQQLIRLHELGTPPNIMEFGVTKETQERLMSQVREELIAKGVIKPGPL